MREKSKMTVKRLATILMAVLVVITSIGLDPQEVSAAKKSQNRIEFKTSTYNLYVGEYASITVDKVYCGGDCTYNSKAVKKAVSKKEFNYTSNNSAVQVSKTGVITVKGKHDATITVTSKYSSAVKGKIKVHVTKKAQKNAKLELQGKKTIGVGKTTTIEIKTLKGVSSKGVKFSIEKEKDKKVASVTSKGVVTGKKKGTATITVTSKVNKKVKATFKVTVRNNDTLSTKITKTGKKSITLAKDYVELAPQSSFQYWQDLQNNMPKKKLTVAYLLETYESGAMDLDGSVVAAQMMKSNEKKYGKAQIKIKRVTGLKSADVKYKSSKPSVATVSETGEVTPKKAGKAVITVTSKEDKTVTATYTVIVKNYVTGFDFMKYTNLYKNKYAGRGLYVCALPSDAENQDYTVTSSDPIVIKVEKYANGACDVYGMKKGKATLTLKSKDGKCKISWECTVSGGETTCWGWDGCGD